MEEQKKYAEAEKAYSAAKDVDGVIRMNLNFLQNPEKAFELVRYLNSLLHLTSQGKLDPKKVLGLWRSFVKLRLGTYEQQLNSF